MVIIIIHNLGLSCLTSASLAPSWLQLVERRKCSHLHCNCSNIVRPTLKPIMCFSGKKITKRWTPDVLCMLAYCHVCRLKRCGENKVLILLMQNKSYRSPVVLDVFWIPAQEGERPFNKSSLSNAQVKIMNSPGLFHPSCLKISSFRSRMKVLLCYICSAFLSATINTFSVSWL